MHRDIAARNMLVREHKTIPNKLEVKISDWGLSRKAVECGAYQAQTAVSRSTVCSTMQINCRSKQ